MCLLRRKGGGGKGERERRRRIKPWGVICNTRRGGIDVRSLSAELSPLLLTLWNHIGRARNHDFSFGNGEESRGKSRRSVPLPLIFGRKFHLDSREKTLVEIFLKSSRLADETRRSLEDSMRTRIRCSWKRRGE